MIFTLAFWKGALDRALRSGAQFVLLVLGVGVAAGGVDNETAQTINAFALDYKALGGAFLGGALMSVVTSVAFPGNVPNDAPDDPGKHVASARGIDLYRK